MMLVGFYDISKVHQVMGFYWILIVISTVVHIVIQVGVLAFLPDYLSLDI